MEYSTIIQNIDSRGVMTIALNRPEKHNALSATMIAEITAVAQSVAENSDVRVVILEGKGKSFCAGGDLDWMRTQMTATREQRIVEAYKLAEMLRTLNELPKPLIAKINGNAFGGGIGLISICDIAFCTKTAKFGLTETRLGLIPATISPYVIAKIGTGLARRIFMSAKIFDASDAHTLGFVSTPVEDLDLAVEQEVTAYLRAAPEAVAASKALVRSFEPEITPQVINRTIEILADVWENPEAHEGVAAFFEKRKPDWVK